MVAQKSISTVMFDTEQFALTDGDEILIKGVSPKVTATGGSTAQSLADWVSNIRTRLTATTSYWVTPTGSDSNDGLTFAGAFATLQKAVDTVRDNIDFASNFVTIKLSAGAYTAGCNIEGLTGGGYLLIQGQGGTPTLTTTSDHCFDVSNNSYVILQGIDMSTVTAKSCVNAQYGARVSISTGCILGASADAHLAASYGGTINATTNYTIDGNAVSHLHATRGGVIVIDDRTVTLTGTPAFSAYFAGVSGGFISAIGSTFTGSATGPRFLAHYGGTIRTNTNDLTYLPGDSAGAWTKNGTYDSYSDDRQTGAAATAIADVADAINTTGKHVARTVFDTTNNRLMVASGAAAADPWYVADGSASVTPS